MNNYFNFKIPDFQQKYGEDWNDFLSVVDDNVDNIINKTIQLYWLKDPSRMTLLALEASLDLRGITYTTNDSTATKKFKLRQFNPTFRDKGLADPYLDLAENITGVRGSLSYYNLYSVWDGSGVLWDGDSTRWDGDGEGIFVILFNIKTTDPDQINTILTLLKEKTMKPAFYYLILIDDDYNTLGVV